MKRSRRILLVDDNPDDVFLTVRAFEKSSVPSEIVVAGDGQTALDILLGKDDQRWSSTLPDMVLLDLNLPKINGIEILRTLRADPRTRRLPIVILSSSTEERDLVSSYDLGANSFVRKPVDFGEFLKAAEQLGVYWLNLNQPAPDISAVPSS